MGPASILPRGGNFADIALARQHPVGGTESGESIRELARHHSMPLSRSTAPWTGTASQVLTGQRPRLRAAGFSDVQRLDFNADLDRHRSTSPPHPAGCRLVRVQIRARAEGADMHPAVLDNLLSK
jgi:hypothetical protein